MKTTYLSVLRSAGKVNRQKDIKHSMICWHNNVKYYKALGFENYFPEGLLIIWDKEND